MEDEDIKIAAVQKQPTKEETHLVASTATVCKRNASINKSNPCEYSLLLLLPPLKKKNSVKNILRAFNNFVQILSQDEFEVMASTSSVNNFFKSVDELRKKYQRYNKQTMFNNTLVCRLIEHSHYGIVFRYFLANHADKWLENSDIADKISQKSFIEFCKKAVKSPEKYLEELKIIKKKHFKLTR